MAGPLTDRSPHLDVSVQTYGPELLVKVAGELDMATAPDVLKTLDHVSQSCRRVVVDASGVTFLDAAGLRALRGGPAGWGEGVETVLRAPSPPVRRLLEITGLCGLVEAPVEGWAGNGGRPVSIDTAAVPPRGG